MNIIKDVARIDKARIVGRISRTDEGYLYGEAVVARTGILEYFENGKIIRELVTPEELARTDSIDSLKMKPVTNNHPSVTLLNASNVKQYQVGYTGERVNCNDGLLVSSLTVTDGEAIREIDSGKRELSCGYTCDLMEESGIWNGQRYDRRQTNRKYNHVAICDLARAGSVASLHLDAADVYECGTADFKESTTLNNNPSTRSYVMPVVIKIDGIEYKDQAPEVLRHIEKLDAQIASLNTKIAEVTKTDGEKQVKIDALTAERDTVKTQLEKAKEDAKNLPAQIAAAAKARAELVKQVMPHLDQETVTKIDSLSDVEIKRAVALKAFPTSKEKIEKIDAAANVSGIDTWFDTAIATLSDNRFDAAARENRQAVGGNRNDDGNSDGGNGPKKPLSKTDVEQAVCDRYKSTSNRDSLMKG